MSKNNKNYQNQNNNNQKPTLTEEQLKAKMAFAENMVPKEASEAKAEEVAPVVEGAVETTEAKTEVTSVEEAPVNDEVKIEAPAEEIPSEPEQVTQEEGASEVEEPVVVDEEEKEVDGNQETPSPVISSIPDSKKMVIADKGRFTNEEIIAKLKKVGLSAAVDQNNDIVIAIYTHNDGDMTVLNPFVKRVLAAGFKTAIVDNTPIREN